MEVDISLEEYIKNYNTAIFNKCPKFFYYLNYINMSATNINWLGENLFDQDIAYDNYQDYIGSVELIDLTRLIISSLGSDYLQKFETCLIDGTISFYDADIDSYSYTRFEHNHFDINIDRNYNIEDVMKLVHEFFHFIHIEQFEDKLEDENCYVYTELFALIGEIYAVLYLYKNNIYKNDVCNYLKKFIKIMYYYARNSLIQGFIMHVYDTSRSFDNKALEDYFDLTGIPESFTVLFELIDEVDNFDFHEKDPYILGFLPAYLIVQFMINDEYFISKFKYCINHINNYVEIEELFSYFNIDNLIKDNNNLADVSNQLYEEFNKLLNNNEIVYQKKIGEIWS